MVVDAFYVITESALAGRIPERHGGRRATALIRWGIAGTVLIGLAVQLGGPAAQGTPNRSHRGAVRVTVTCPVTRRAPRRPSAATGSSDQLQVTVPPAVFVTVKSGVLRVSTNTGRLPATRDEFYLIRGDHTGHAPAIVVETVLRNCR